MTSNAEWFIRWHGLPPFGTGTDSRDAKFLQFIEDIKRDTWQHATSEQMSADTRAVDEDREFEGVPFPNV